MLLVKRPKAPPGFNRGAKAARDEIRSIIAGKVPGKRRPLSDDFEDRWSDFKHLLAEAEGHRCGYCDRKVLGGDDGTIDHYRPKAEIEALHDDPGTWGTQRAHSASVRDRSTQTVSEFGYHWLAYAWHNYVFACGCCNKKWKRAIFPVTVHPRCCPPRPRGSDGALLMSCYGSWRPSDHLRFNDDGTVEARRGSPAGQATIITVGLHREPLRDERKEVAEDVHALLHELADAAEEQEARVVRDLLRKGREDRAFAGVARAIVEQELGIDWQEFVATFS